MRTDLKLGPQPLSEYMAELQILAGENHKRPMAFYTRLKESTKHDLVSCRGTESHMARDTESMLEYPQTTHPTTYTQHRCDAGRKTRMTATGQMPLVQLGRTLARAAREGYSEDLCKPL